MADGASKPRKPRMVTLRMVLVSVVMGVVLAVASVPVAVAIEQICHASPPFPDSVIEVIVDHGDRVTSVDCYSTVGYRIWNSWNSGDVEIVVRLNPEARPVEHDPRPDFAIACRGQSGDGDIFMMCMYAGWPMSAAKGRWWGTQAGTDQEFFYEPQLFGVVWQIPIYPNWSGALANTLFYAIIVLVLLAAGRFTRMQRRRKLGRCVACGYELGLGVGVCPECGLASATLT